MMNTTPSAPLKSPDLFFIDGRWVAPSSDALIDVITPSTEQLYVQVAAAQAADIDRAVAAARAAFDTGPWPRMSHAERAEYLRRIGAEIVARSEQLADIWTSEMGVLRAIGGVTIPVIASVYDYYASLADTYPFEERHEPRLGGVGLLVREPVGVVGAILPWNGPLGCLTYKLAPALLAGCTLVIKSSPEAPGSALIMAEICEAIGLPAGVVNVITADREASEALVSHPGIDKIAFTGSSAVGKRIASICSDRVARYTLELGGKSAAIILDDYDLETAATAISASARVMSGQVCSSLTRIIVDRRRHDAFVDALGAAFAEIRVGDPFSADIDMGPLAMNRQRERVEYYLEKGRAEGATVVAGGGRPAHLNRGFFVEPTVFGNVDNAMTIAREEIFGPVVSVIPADSEDQAIAIANDTVFGLNASVFTDDSNRAYRVARRLFSGTVGHNRNRTDLSIAFGGFKQSGVGREGGAEGLLAYLEAKTVVLDEAPEHLDA